MVATWTKCNNISNAKGECDWVVMSSVFVASQSPLLARANVPSGKLAYARNSL